MLGTLRRGQRPTSSSSESSQQSDEQNTENISDNLPGLTLIRKLGHGSFGHVILASDHSTKNKSKHPEQKGSKNDLVAVKFVVRKSSKKSYSEPRILTEIAPMNKHLISCRRCFEVEDTLIYVMEYGGQDLRYYLNKHGTFSEAKTGVVAVQIFQALSFLHQNGVIYRDLKPENILLASDGLVRLTDFGLSCFLSERKTSHFKSAFEWNKVTGDSNWGFAKSTSGTPVYQSPEAICGKKYQFDADWWSFGVVLYEILVGVTPFRGRTVFEVHDEILNSSVQCPSFLSQEALNLIQSLLTKNRKHRLGVGSKASEQIWSHKFFRKYSRDCPRTELKSILTSAPVVDITA